MTTTEFSLKNLKEIEQQIKDIVYGYIRQKNKELSLGIIPSLIKSICLLYFYESEYFLIAANGIEISEDKRTIVKRSNVGWTTTVYGNQWVESMTNNIIKWKFKIVNAVGEGSGIAIGIVASDDCLNKDFCYATDRISYCYSSYPVKMLNGQSYDKHNAFKIKNDDIVTFILDLGQRKIFYNKNNDNDEELGDENVMFDQVEKSKDVRYKIAACLRNKEDSIQLVRFTQIIKS